MVECHEKPRAGELSNHTVVGMLRTVFGSGDPVALWIGLSHFRPGARERAYPFEPRDAAYRRIRVTNTSDNFRVDPEWVAQVSIDVRLDWPDPTEDWGGIRELCIFDAPTGGRMLAFCRASRRVAVEVRPGLPFPPSDPGYYRIGIWGAW